MNKLLTNHLLKIKLDSFPAIIQNRSRELNNNLQIITDSVVVFCGVTMKSDVSLLEGKCCCFSRSTLAVILGILELFFASVLLLPNIYLLVNNDSFTTRILVTFFSTSKRASYEVYDGKLFHISIYYNFKSSRQHLRYRISSAKYHNDHLCGMLDRGNLQEKLYSFTDMAP